MSMVCKQNKRSQAQMREYMRNQQLDTVDNAKDITADAQICSFIRHRVMAMPGTGEMLCWHTPNNITERTHVFEVLLKLLVLWKPSNFSWLISVCAVDLFEALIESSPLVLVLSLIVTNIHWLVDLDQGSATSSP